MNGVSCHENEQVSGLALCDPMLWEGLQNSVNDLRQRQADYLASLPTDPNDCIEAARKAINPVLDDSPEELEEALHLSFALEPMIRHLQTDHPGPERDALIYIVDRINSSLLMCVPKMEHVANILDGPRRAEAAAWVE